MAKIKSILEIDSRNNLILTEETSDGSSKDKIKAGVKVLKTTHKKTLKKVLLNGEWSLTREHALKLRLSGTNSSIYGKEIIFAGDIVKVTSSGLSFRIRKASSISGLSSSKIELKGVWRADKYNRITFNVSRSAGRSDVLTFGGKWDIDKNNELVYRYKRILLKSGKTEEKRVIFKGYWEFGKSRLVYRMESGSNSYFEFKGSLQSKSIRAKDGVMRYQLGVRYLKKEIYRNITKKVSVFGKWKLNRDFSVGFEVFYSKGKYKESIFTADKIVGDKSKITLYLKNEKDEKLGMELEFTRAFSKDADIFLLLSRFPGEAKIMGGVRVKF